jgi:hypothetical protein
MKELTNLELLMEYMEQNQYFIGNDLLAKYNELLQKEKQEQLTLTDVVGQSEQLVCPECKSTDCKTAIHTDYKECNKCYHYWEAR